MGRRAGKALPAHGGDWGGGGRRLGLGRLEVVLEVELAEGILYHNVHRLPMIDMAFFESTVVNEIHF